MSLKKILFTTDNSPVFRFAVTQLERAGYNVDYLHNFQDEWIDDRGMALFCEEHGEIIWSYLSDLSQAQLLKSIGYTRCRTLDELICTLKSYKSVERIGRWVYSPSHNHFFLSGNPSTKLEISEVKALSEFLAKKG
jgi:hypothetical protein